MDKQFCFYAQKDGKSFKNFNRNPMHFRMFGHEDPTKVVVYIVEDKPTHFGFLTNDNKLEFIYKEESQVKISVEGHGSSVLSGSIVKLKAVDYAEELEAAA